MSLNLNLEQAGGAGEAINLLRQLQPGAVSDSGVWPPPTDDGTTVGTGAAAGAAADTSHFSFFLYVLKWLALSDRPQVLL